ncbi:hypothetical protein MN608_01977 [Microdochium nivale]|nr:hypothetical protein MN608_01977 [Microdochium nivale]
MQALSWQAPADQPSFEPSSILPLLSTPEPWASLTLISTTRQHHVGSLSTTATHAARPCWLYKDSSAPASYKLMMASLSSPLHAPTDLRSSIHSLIPIIHSHSPTGSAIPSLSSLSLSCRVCPSQPRSASNYLPLIIQHQPAFP